MLKKKKKGTLSLACLGADNIQGDLGTTTSKGVFLQCCSWQWILSASTTSDVSVSSPYLLWRDAQRSTEICQWESTLAISEMSEGMNEGLAWSREGRQTMSSWHCWSGNFPCAVYLHIFFSVQKREACPAGCSRAYHTISAQEHGRFLVSPFPNAMTAVWEESEHWWRLEEEDGSVRRCGNQSKHVRRVWLATPSMLCLELG